MPFDERFLRGTIEVWQPLSVEPLTMADVQEIAESVTGFFSALARCAKEAGIRRNRPLPVGNQDDHRQPALES